MPAPIAVELVPHDPRWAAQAAAETAHLQEAVAPLALAIHHIGSTAIRGVAAKPIIDLLGGAPDLAAFETSRPAIEASGYAWHGEYGLEGRRYCTLSDATGRRLFHLHVYAEGDPELARHLAFRDHLRARPELAAAYECEKRRAAILHPHDSHAYSDAKSDWISRVEAEALKNWPCERKG